VAVLAAFPTVASGAGVVTTSATEIFYTGSASADSVSADDAGTNSYQLAENGITESSTSCTLNTVPNPDVVTCSGTDWIRVRINLGAGDDAVDASLVDGSDDPTDGFYIQGEAGDDGNILGSSDGDVIDGGADSDNATATGLNGGPGSDNMVGGPNDAAGDEISGGAGAGDMATYQCDSDEPITVTIDDINNDGGGGCDGTTGAFDDVHTDVEGVTGGEGADTLNGNGANNRLEGGGGNDILNGGDGDDLLQGTYGIGGCAPVENCTGNDTLNGEGGNDTLYGDIGNDRLDGGTGVADELIGGPDIDRVLFSTCGSAVTVTIDTDAASSNDDGCTDGSGDFAFDDVRQDVESVTGTESGDTITGNCLANTFAGSANVAADVAPIDGNDIFNGDPAAGCLVATTDGTEADFMGGGEGSDTFNGDGSGNAGFDTVTYGAPYTGHTTSGGTCLMTVNRAVEVTLDDSGNDCDGFGNTTESVNGDINRLIGSPLADSINAAGADQDVQLFGRLGDDLLTDGPFNDLLNGEGGTDTVSCPNGGTNVSINSEAGSC
jgi:RTX calcium-binding nonapeptide repeat (4 copies)